jgi:hypothetical protein
MSCLVCHQAIGSSYVVTNNVKLHKECERNLDFCDVCYNRSVVGGKCFMCVAKSHHHRCDTCNQRLVDGQMYAGKLMCRKCISDESDRKRKYVDSCFKTNICYKCSSPLKCFTETRYFGVTAAEYEVDVVQCPKCGVLK